MNITPFPLEVKHALPGWHEHAYMGYQQGCLRATSGLPAGLCHDDDDEYKYIDSFPQSSITNTVPP